MVKFYSKVSPYLYGDLFLCRNSSLIKLVHQRLLVDLFQETMSQVTMHFHRRSDNGMSFRVSPARNHLPPDSLLHPLFVRFQSA